MHGSIYLVSVHVLTHSIPQRARIFCGDLLTKRAVKTARGTILICPACSKPSLPSLLSLFNCVDRDMFTKRATRPARGQSSSALLAQVPHRSRCTLCSTCVTGNVQTKTALEPSRAGQLTARCYAEGEFESALAPSLFHAPLTH
jgi:hypothetical protein